MNRGCFMFACSVNCVECVTLTRDVRFSSQVILSFIESWGMLWQNRTCGATIFLAACTDALREVFGLFVVKLRVRPKVA